MLDVFQTKKGDKMINKEICAKCSDRESWVLNGQHFFFWCKKAWALNDFEPVPDDCVMFLEQTLINECRTNDKRSCQTMINEEICVKCPEWEEYFYNGKPVFRWCSKTRATPKSELPDDCVMFLEQTLVNECRDKQ